ncbi:hypothetical protein HWB96_gp02 [Arthrobacter phage Mendel]|uniref:Uncharacterized protein n=1 Tax=Arthrobacter phage Mendel TaxID=2484218 RepID=A0A3G3M0Y8_9CAUD|nr:hypothetical protein HWB96_gp02 [Arthrobacter phage Mendel]AYQ99916.1 hypothetical protein PBI_MENDEL_2 [Arthrobacter phage Mendel]
MMGKQFEVHGSVSFSFTAIIDAATADAAEAIAERDKVAFFLQALEEGDTPDENDIDVEFAQKWEG